MTSTPLPGPSTPGKRLIVACDSVWPNSGDGLCHTTGKPRVTNMTRLCRALLPTSEDGTPQILHYQGGPAIDSNWYSYILDVYLGDGLGNTIKEAYTFLCENYAAGDDIFLIGFSRGAFTASSVCDLISAIGLLNEEGLLSLDTIYADWAKGGTAEHGPLSESDCWPRADRPVRGSHHDDMEYVNGLVLDGLTRPCIPVIRAIGVWGDEAADDDELGVRCFSEGLPLQISDTLWEPWEPNLSQLGSTWGPRHEAAAADAGLVEHAASSDSTLAWVMTQLAPHLAFEPAYDFLWEPRAIDLADDAVAAALRVEVLPSRV